MVLLVIEVLLDRIECEALLDIGCFRTRVKRSAFVFGGKRRLMCSERTERQSGMLRSWQSIPRVGKILDSDILLWIDAIKSLGRVRIDPTAEMHLKIDDPAFSIDFNWQMCVWYTSYK